MESNNKQVNLTDVSCSDVVYINHGLAEYIFDSCDLTNVDATKNASKSITIRNNSNISGKCELGAWQKFQAAQVNFLGELIVRDSSGCTELKIAGCQFRGEVKIHGVTASNGLQIIDCRFQEGFSFNCKVKEEAVFESSEFFKRANFQGSKFEGRTSFKGSIFHCAPEFFDVALFPDTHLQQTEFLAFDGEREYAAYRELRHICHNTMKSAQDESRFFAFEQRSLATVQIKQKGKRLEGWLSKLYGLASDYGQSILRPFGGLVFVNASFAGIFALIPNAVTVADEAVKAQTWQVRSPDYVGLTFQNLLQPFSFMGKTAAYIPSCGWVAFLSGIQTVLSLILFALFILAVRRRFRKGSE